MRKTTMPDIPITPIDSPPSFVVASPIILMLDGIQVYGVIDIVKNIDDIVDLKIDGKPMLIRVISRIENELGVTTITAETLP